MMQRTPESLQSIHARLSHLIELAVTGKEIEYLREAVKEYDQAIHDDMEEESLKEKLFECYVLFIAIAGEYNLDDQRDAWENFAASDTPITFDSGREYLINQFLKKPFQAKQYKPVLKAVDTVIFACCYLFSKFVWRKGESEIFNNFNKNVELYRETSLRIMQMATKETDNRGSANITFATLEELTELDREAITAVRITAIALISKCYTSSKTQQALNIMQMLSAYTICGLYTYEFSMPVTNEHRRHLLSDYREYVKKTINLKLKGDIYPLLANGFIEIFTRSFPKVDSAKALLIINKLKESITTAQEKDPKNSILVELTKCIIRELDGFYQHYQKLDGFYIQCSKKICDPASNKSELIQTEKELKKFISENIPKQCVFLLASFYEKIAEINIRLKQEDKRNEEPYRQKIIASFKNAKKCAPDYYPKINVLYNAGINVFEIHVELNKVVNDIKIAIKKNENNSLFSNVDKYLQYIVGTQIGLKKEISVYNHEHSLSMNLVRLINETLHNLLKRKYIHEMIHCCQAMEQLLKASDFENKIPDVYQAVMAEVINAKLQGLNLLLHKPDSDIKIIGWDQQYLSGIILLKNVSDAGWAETETLLDDLILYYQKSHNAEKAEYYLEQGIILFPENILFHQKKIVIEHKKIEDEIQKCKDQSEHEKESPASLLKQSAGNINDLPPNPVLPENDSTNSQIIVEYNNLSASHTDLVKRRKEIKAKQTNMGTLVKQYQTILSRMDIFVGEQSTLFSKPGLDELLNTPANNKIDFLYSHLKNVSAVKSHCSVLITCFDKIKSAHQDIIKSIKEYEKYRDDFNRLLNKFESLAARIKAMKSAGKMTFFSYLLIEAKPLLSNVYTEQSAALGLIRIEEDMQRENILLNGSGKAISSGVLSLLFKLDKTLRDAGSRLIFKGSLVTRFSIYHFNDQPHAAGLFPMNDIDIHIPFDSNVNYNDIVNILEQHGFIASGNEFQSLPYLQFTRCMDGIDLDLTFATQSSYYSFDFLTLRMGTMEFTQDRDNCDNLVKAYTHSFKLILPDGYENEFINACKFGEFTMKQPDTRFRAYCYGIYKYLAKLSACDVYQFNYASQSSSDLIHYHELYSVLVTHFTEQLQTPRTSCYLELNEFIKQGINQDTKHLAVPSISAFFLAVISSQVYYDYKQLTDDQLREIADNCAEHFIAEFEICKEKRMNHTPDLPDRIQAIAFFKRNQYLSCLLAKQSQYNYPGTFYQSVEHHVERNKRHRKNFEYRIKDTNGSRLG